MAIAIAALVAPLRTFRLQSEQARQSWLYDALMRVPILGWSALIVLQSTMRLYDWIQTADPAMPAFTFGVNIAMRLSTIAFCALIAGTVVLRLRPAARARGLEPRFSALFGSFLVTGLVFFRCHELSFAGEMVSTILVLTGNALAVVALVQLGRSFSIMAEARRLVRSGLYGIIRHPLYLAEEIAIIGIVMQFLSVWTALLCVAHLAFQLRRIQNEENVLASSFPEYSAYQARTARLLPGIY